MVLKKNFYVIANINNIIKGYNAEITIQQQQNLAKELMNDLDFTVFNCIPQFKQIT